MLTTKTRMALNAGVTGLATAVGLMAFAGLSKKMKKPYVPALLGGGVAATVSFLWQIIDIYLIEKELGVAMTAVDEFINSGRMDEAAKLLKGGGLSGLGMTYADRKRVGLFNVQKVGLIDAQRTGLYVREPSVKKYNTEPTTRYYS
jgi:hypothetical protein